MAEWTEMVWEAPVTDRVEADCVYGNPKGCLSVEFLNRMEMNTEFIKCYLEFYHIYVDSLDTEVDKWARELYLRISEFNRLEQNLISIRATGIINSDTPVITKSTAEQKPLWTHLNDMEQLLLDIKTLLDGIPNRMRKLGTFTAGNNLQVQVIRR